MDKYWRVCWRIFSVQFQFNFLVLHSALAQSDQTDSSLSRRTLILQHCFESSEDYQLQCRLLSEIPVSSFIVNQTQTFSHQLSTTDQERVKKLNGKDDLYFIRARMSSGIGDQYMQSYCRAADVFKPTPAVALTVNLDALGKVFALEASPVDRRDPRIGNLIDLETESTSILLGIINVRGSQQGPTPDLEGYKKKLAKEKAEKLAAEAGDNRSFFAKYWMYIVPAVLFMMFSGQLGGGGQGGGAPA